MIPITSMSFNPSLHRPGTVVSTSRALYQHVGIISDCLIDGQQAVISNSGGSGMVVEEPLAKFQGAGDFRIVGYISALPHEVVLSRARAKLGSRYSIFGWNCEHFVRYAHGIKQESPQLVAAVSLFAMAFVISRL